MKFYNSLSDSVEPFEPRGNEVSVYTCGITPYDTTHLGHAFTYTAVDILIRFLEYQGLRIRYVQNVTDIDDDILRKAREVGQDWRELGNCWTAFFIRDMISLNVRPPDFYPRATDVIAEITELVQRLLAAGYAYESGGSVYFHVASWPDFGKLSDLSLQEMLPIANQRGNNPNDPNKRDPLDFVLWQAQAPGEPAWESPWGPGRPGWHIECSTMATRFLGETIDFHSGGGDLIFPHHECEIAQIEPVSGRRPFVRFWFHVAMVHHEGEKMSKSLGNLLMVRDLLNTYSPDDLRLYLARHHYREAWVHSDAELGEAASIAAALKRAVDANGGTGKALDPSRSMADFEAALADDLDTWRGRQVLADLAAAVIQAAELGMDVGQAQAALRRMGRVFGLRLDAAAPEEGVKEGWQRHLARFPCP